MCSRFAFKTPAASVEVCCLWSCHGPAHPAWNWTFALSFLLTIVYGTRAQLQKPRKVLKTRPAGLNALRHLAFQNELGSSACSRNAIAEKFSGWAALGRHWRPATCKSRVWMTRSFYTPTRPPRYNHQTRPPLTRLLVFWSHGWWFADDDSH